MNDNDTHPGAVGHTSEPQYAALTARTLTRTQGLCVWDMMRGGLPPAVLCLLGIPQEGRKYSTEVELPVVKQNHRMVCQFLRDLADSIDPEGPQLNRYLSNSQEVVDLYAFMAQHNLTMEGLMSTLHGIFTPTNHNSPS